MKITIVEKKSNKLRRITCLSYNPFYISKEHKECVRVQITNSDYCNFDKKKYNFIFG